MALTVKKVAQATKPGRYREGSVRGLYLQVMSASNRILKRSRSQYAHLTREEGPFWLTTRTSG